MQAIKVMKFGGTSVGDAARMSRVADIILEYMDYKVVVVVSAMSGITDQLVASHKAASKSDITWKRDFDYIQTRHLDTLYNIDATSHEKHSAEVALRKSLGELHDTLEAIAAGHDKAKNTYDKVVSFGERLNVELVNLAARARGINSIPVIASKLIVTSDEYGDAEPLLEQTERRVKAGLQRYIDQGVTPIVTGFIGATSAGEITTLGRGASDYTATLLGYSLDADEVIIWTDVSGVMTADPRVIPEAETVQNLTYEEAAELSYFGAKVLHPLTMVPASLKNIPIRIKNSFRTDASGTVISNFLQDSDEKVIKAITPKKGLALVAIKGGRQEEMVTYLTAITQVLREERVSPYLMVHGSAEGGISVAVDEDKAILIEQRIRTLLSSELERVSLEIMPAMTIIAVVGEGVYNVHGVYAKVFSALGASGIKIYAIATDVSRRTLSIVVRQDDSLVAVRGLHQGLHMITNRQEGDINADKS